VIRVRDLSKRYPSGTVALDGVTLDVGAGEFVALIGSSGAGKSTFLRCLNGLVTPTAGLVSVDDRPVTGASRNGLRSVRASVGFVFQQFNLLKRLSVLENVLVGTLSRVEMWRSLLGRFPGGELERARRTLRRVGLAGLDDRRADTLSGGQQQRVAIARALVQEPRVLLADEPMSSLDPASSRSVMELLQDINRQDGLTVIASLHVLDLAVTYGRRIVGLRAGRVVHDGPPEGLTQAAAEAIFGGERL
jgi:phosphonate transport system ATP-binding protein